MILCACASQAMRGLVCNNQVPVAAAHMQAALLCIVAAAALEMLHISPSRL
jgi:hypothetical protein